MKNDHFRPGKALQARFKSPPGVNNSQNDCLLNWVFLLYAMQNIRLRPVISTPGGGHIVDFLVFAFGRRL